MSIFRSLPDALPKIPDTLHNPRNPLRVQYLVGCRTVTPELRQLGVHGSQVSQPRSRPCAVIRERHCCGAATSKLRNEHTVGAVGVRGQLYGGMLLAVKLNRLQLEVGISRQEFAHLAGIVGEHSTTTVHPSFQSASWMPIRTVIHSRMRHTSKHIPS